MGFRDVQAFNLALLAKQAWRLIHNTHSLFFRVCKSRYFPNCSFMDAELGSNPPYVWRSLLAGREIIWEGSRWRVWDGNTIGVTTHKWLSRRPVFLGEQQMGLKVKDLIDSNTMQWDREKIFYLFAHKTRMEIMSIPLQQNTAGRDVLVWTKNQSQSFSVKSAYRIAVRMKEQTRIEHSTANTERPIWRKLWKLNVPPKVRMFLWGACANVLPTKENLNRRRIQVDPWCETCCQQPELIGHLLWECPLAQNVWVLCRGGLQKCQNNLRDFFLLFRTLLDRLSKTDVERWAVTSWAIWNARINTILRRSNLIPRIS